jgi:preprotein translocase subunit YajC
MIDVAYAQSPAGAAPMNGPEQFLFSFAPIIAIVLIFYFMIIRPQQKKQKETQAMLASIRKGDRVLTSGGIYGTVVGTKDDLVVLKVSDEVKIEFSRQSIVQVQSRGE